MFIILYNSLQQFPICLYVYCPYYDGTVCLTVSLKTFQRCGFATMQLGKCDLLLWSILLFT